jgi:hypothetical protein
MAKTRANVANLPVFGPLVPDMDQPRPPEGTWGTSGPVVVERTGRTPLVGLWAWWLPAHPLYGATLVVTLDERDVWIPMHGELVLGSGGRVLVGQTRKGAMLTVRAVTEVDAARLGLVVGNRSAVDVVAEALTSV